MSFLTKLFRPFTTSSHPTNIMASTAPEGLEVATFAAGCFWGVEHAFRKQFSGKGLVDARVGYIGGDLQDPSYRAVCNGDTGHAEATRLIFNPQSLSYDTLLQFFYRLHDPTTLNRQGPDMGSQYRSAIFTHSAEQEARARTITEAVGKQWWDSRPVVTQIVDAGEGSGVRWWDAEDYHQEYLVKNPSGYECPSHIIRGFPELKL